MGTNITLLAETHTVYLSCQMIQGLYNTEEQYILKPQLKIQIINCLLTLLPLGPGAPTAP